MLRAFRQIGQLSDFSRLGEGAIWDAIQRHRQPTPDAENAEDLRLPERRVFTAAQGGPNTPDFRLHVVAGPPAYASLIERVVLVERMREVKTLTGFTRIDSPGEGLEVDAEDEIRTVAPLSRRAPTWLPAVEVRGEGIFLQFSEARIAEWMGRPAVRERALTGPALHRTDQALQELILAAHESLLLVSFVVYVVPHIAKALVDVAARGVRIHIALETPSESAGRIDYDTVRALGSDVIRNADLYIWPESQRRQDAQGSLGVLHAKCAVADRRLLFVSSANLTGYALTINMELGLMIKGGPLPGDVVTHFERLIEQGILRKLVQ